MEHRSSGFKSASVACGSILLAAVLSTTPVGAGTPDIDILAATPVGSWQLRETVATDHKGKQSVVVSRTSLVGEEERQGEAYVWIEMALENFEIDKTKRKKKGDRMLVKVLVKRSALRQDPANIVNNLSGFGEEIIFQTGDQKPMRVSGGGMMAETMMKSMGVKVAYDFAEAGEETIDTPAGRLECRKVTGKGSVEAKVLFRKTKIESESVSWLSTEVPFGVAKMTETSTVNGKPQSSETTLLEYGKEGAVSAITGEIQEMPSLFGN